MPAPPLAFANNRAYVAAHFALELDTGGNVGLFRSIEGGSLKADVVTYQTGGMHGQFRQLGKPKYDDLKLQVGMAMSAPFYTWISRFFTGVPDTRSGAIVAADFKYTERARRTFSGALIKEVSFPKLDATDKSAAYMSVGVAVEHIDFTVGSGQQIKQNEGMPAQKLWASCNFRVSLDGYDCSRVSKVDAFTIKQNVIEHHVGGFRAPFKVPSRIDIPTIAFYLPEADAGPFYKRAMDVAADGHPSGSTHGMIEILDNGGATLAELAFRNSDILSVTPDRSDASSEEIKQVKVEVYSELMGFSYGNVGLGDLA
ncbi:MAG TPA: phage tail protein [Kofleriaceae bacterium]|jgi:phage tail-like protein